MQSAAKVWLVFETLLDDVKAASLLGVHPKTLQRMARGGEVPAFRVGRFWRYRASQLDQWLQSQAQSPSQPVARVDSKKDGAF